MTEQLLQLIENIEEQNVQYVKSCIQQINKESLEQQFENGNTLLHYVFSCANKEIISLFVSRLEELLGSEEISEEGLTALFRITNDGEFTPIDRILQNDATLKIEATLKGIHTPKILSIFLEARGSDNCTISELIREEFSQKEQQLLFKSMKTGILYLDGWKDLASGLIGRSETLDNKRNLVKLHIEDETLANTDYIKQNSESLALNTLSKTIIKQHENKAKEHAKKGKIPLQKAEEVFSEANASDELRKVLTSFKQVGPNSKSKQGIDSALEKLEHEGWNPENIKIMEAAIGKAKGNYEQKAGALAELGEFEATFNKLEIGKPISPKGKEFKADDEKKAEDVKDDAQQPQKQQASYSATALKLGMIGYKLPQFVGDTYHIMNEVSGGALENNFIENKAQYIPYTNTTYETGINYLSSGTKIISGAVITSVTKNPIPFITSILETDAGYEFAHNHIAGPITNHNQDHLDTFYTIAPLITTTALSFFYGGPVAGAINLVTQGTNLALNYGINHNYISKENPIINWAVKPALAFTGQTANIIYSPLALLKAFEFIHLSREAYDYYKAYNASFEISDDQFPILQKYGYSATSMLDEVLTFSQNDNEKVRQSYNEKISRFYKEHFLNQAKSFHCSDKDITPELAQEASAIRNELKYIHHLATNLLGRAGANMYKLYEYGTPYNPDYDYFHNKGKLDTKIFYSSFKTDGNNLGLKNNGFDKTIELYELLNAKKITAPHEKKIYPENIQDTALITCMESLGDDLSEIVTKCGEYFDFCSIGA